MSGRDPDAVLAELGSDLRRAWSSAPSRRGRLRGRPALLAAVVALLLVPTALATREVLLAPGPPQLPELVRPPDAVEPVRSGATVYVADGLLRDVSYRLSATACDYGPVMAVGLFLDVPGGGAGQRCDIATRVPGAGASPEVLAGRWVQTHFDPRARRTWVFGAVPPEVRGVEVDGADVALLGVDPHAIRRGGLPAGLRVFVTERAGASREPEVVFRDASGNRLTTCGGAACAAYDQQEGLEP